MIFHLLIVYAITSTMQAVMAADNRSQPQIVKRIWLGLIMLIAGQILLFIFSAVTSLNSGQQPPLLPIADRAVTAFSFLWLVWLWAFPNKNRVVDVLLGVLNGLVLLLFFFTLYFWNQFPAGTHFNNSNLDWIWNFFSGFVLLLGITRILIKQPINWGIGLSAMLLNFTALIVFILAGDPHGNYQAILRFSMMCTFPMLPSLARRVSAPIEATSLPVPVTSSGIKVINKHLKFLITSNAADYRGKIPALISEIAGADHCVVAELLPNELMIRLHPIAPFPSLEENAPNVSILEDNLPTLISALKGQYILSQENSPKFIDEYHRVAKQTDLPFDNTIIALPYPIQPGQKNSILLIRPHAQRWGDVEQAELSSNLYSLILLYNQKTREENLLESITLLEEQARHPARNRSINPPGNNAAQLEEAYRLLQSEHEDLKARFEQMSKNLVYLTERVEIHSRSMSRMEKNKTIGILNTWLDQAQVENSLLHAQIEQLNREIQTFELEREHYQELPASTADPKTYLEPMEAQPLDAKTQVNDALAKAFELLYNVAKTQDALEQEQMKRIILLESIQEKIKNIHHLQQTPEQQELPFVTQAEYFLDDLRTAQAMLKEQLKLQTLLEQYNQETLKLKNQFEQLTRANQRGYDQINQLYLAAQEKYPIADDAEKWVNQLKNENAQLKQRLSEITGKDKSHQVTLENLQTELVSALEETAALRERLKQSHDHIYQQQMNSELSDEKIRDHNKIITSILEEMGQPISTITGCANLLTDYSDDESAQKLIEQINICLDTINGQIARLVQSTQRSEQSLKNSRIPLPPQSIIQRPSKKEAK
ncbi:MAG: hypothetical protein JW750_04885 [Anaerolineaceae bacterium]|nr:hypothetical protein [Anaerolineaceae bacterium]